MNWLDKCAKLKAIVVDIDGTLTDGSIGYGCGADQEIKFFSVLDGTGFHIAKCLGFKLIALSGRVSETNRRRLVTELHFDLLQEKCLTKADGLATVCEKFGITPDECMFIGDDLIDLPAIIQSGIGVAVGNAVPEVKEHADWITDACGGHGAAREAIERLVKTLGKWDAVVNEYIVNQNLRPGALS